MARVPNKHGRDQALDFQGFLNDLQDWEISFKEKEKKMKPQAPEKDKLAGEKVPTRKGPVADSSRSNLTYSDAMSHISSSFMMEESLPTATSEKELGNEYFKQKKFNEAIDCYSRSIALSPTAVAYANRAMAYLKIRRFEEAENDCTEALNLDDRYIKAYSRRATARRELKKLKESMEDSEFALKLEPHSQELKKQYADVKSLYEKEILKKASGAPRSSVQGVQKPGNSEKKVNGNGVRSVSNSTQKAGFCAVEEVNTEENEREVTMKGPLYMEEANSKDIRDATRSEGQGVDSSPRDAFQSSAYVGVKRNHITKKQELKASVQELASRAASRGKAEAAKSITAPNSAYQFEISWRGFSGDRVLQGRLLKVTSPSAMPQIFKNALSAPILIDIIKCVATFFTEEMDMAVKYIENLTKVPRFKMIIMCLSSTDKADLLRIWDEVFCNEATPIEYAEILDNLRSKYCLKQ